MPKILTTGDVKQFRQRLCELALKAFAERGIEGISLRGLAAEAGCSRTTPYRYFKNKADILAAVRQSEFQRMADATELVPSLAIFRSPSLCIRLATPSNVPSALAISFHSAPSLFASIAAAALFSALCSPGMVLLSQDATTVPCSRTSTLQVSGWKFMW